MRLKNKQYSRALLYAGATTIVALTLWSSGQIARTLREEEQRKVALWSEAILQRAELVGYTEELFGSLRAEEKKKGELLGQAYDMIKKSGDMSSPENLWLAAAFIESNSTIPVLLYKDGVFDDQANVPPLLLDPERIELLRKAMEEEGSFVPIGEGFTVYYGQSNRFRDLQEVMDNIINSFISETVLNSASIPVLLADSSLTEILRADRFSEEDLQDTAVLIRRLADVNQPILLDLPGAGKRWILYDESLVLKQLRFFPIVQLLIIGGFLLLAYSTFSAFRRSEQNRVWVGMAKETAHQLGTPLSALLGWVEVLRMEQVDEAVLTELAKDIDRLRTVTDRFSKIGSEPELMRGDLGQFVGETMAYLERRMPKAVDFDVRLDGFTDAVAFSPALFGWVLENLTKNAVDAMEGSGRFSVHLSTASGRAILDFQDTGKGMSRRVLRQVFDPGFSTKSRGWGLGLSLVRRIVREYHGGQIVVLRSEEGQGTTFRITLPLVSEELG